jgi:hypothetical protein
MFKPVDFLESFMVSLAIRETVNQDGQVSTVLDRLTIARLLRAVAKAREPGMTMEM